jgi:GT2 family glycosyltransferase
MSPSNNPSPESICSFTESEFPFVSVIILNYNGYQCLKVCLPSLVKTDYPKFEIIVVDNGSTDQSVDYLRNNWQHCIRIIELHENLGFAEGNNIGILNANGEIIAILNNDIEVEGNWLRSAVGALLSDRKVAAVQSKIMQYAERDKIDCVGLSFDKFGLVVNVGRDEKDHGQYDYLHEIWGCSGGAMIGWKHRLIEAGLFDRTFFIYYEDVDLSWRLKLCGYKMLLAPSSFVYHMGKATSKTIPSSFVVFHSTKNYIASWLKNYSLRMLIIKCPSIFFIVVGALLFEIVQGRYDLFMARLKSIMWIWRNLRNILKERHKIQHVLRRKEVDDNIIFTQDKKIRSNNLLYVIRSILQNS